MKRIEWLRERLGFSAASATVADLQTAQQQLDEAGIERKELTAPAEDEKPTEAEPKPEDENKEGDMVSSVADRLAQQVFDARGGDLSSLTVEELSTIIEDALRPAVEPESAPEAEPTPQGEDQTMEDNNKAQTVPQVDETQKAAAEIILQMVADQGEMAKSYAALEKQVKGLSEAIPQLIDQVRQLQEQINGKPRAASAATETEIDPQTDASKALELAVKKGINGGKVVLGIPVND